MGRSWPSDAARISWRSLRERDSRREYSSRSSAQRPRAPAPTASTLPAPADAAARPTCPARAPISTGGMTRRVRLVRGEGRDVSA